MAGAQVLCSLCALYIKTTLLNALGIEQGRFSTQPVAFQAGLCTEWLFL